MKTFVKALYCILKLIMLWLIISVIYSCKEPLQNIATELRIANEITMCVEDPNCTPNSEM